MTHPVIREVARAIYSPVVHAQGGQKTWFDQLPPDAQAFIEEQATSAIARLHISITPDMVSAAADQTDPTLVFKAMLEAVLGEVPQ